MTTTYTATQVSEVLAAVDTLIQVTSDMTHDCEPWTAFNCSEVEAIVGVIHAAGRPELASIIIELHAHGDDDPDDEHHDMYVDLRAREQ